MVADGTCGDSPNLLPVPDEYRSKWYFSRKEIENDSPSRKDGIDLRKENQLRMLYCSFLQELGMKLGVPQVTIATAVMFCHRFFLRQSHAKNDWQTIAIVCMFLASKAEETPCALSKMIPMAYEMLYRKDPVAVQRIHLKEFYEKQKELILVGERLLLSTLAFDLNIQHPYKPLVAAVKKLGILQNDILKVAWNFVNDWLRTTLCLQYKPHYIAAGSLYIAAKLNIVKLPTERGFVWWHEFDVTPRQLEEVIQQMMELLGNKRRVMAPCTNRKPIPAPLAVQKEESSSPESCVLTRPGSSSSHDLCGEVRGDVTTRYADYSLPSRGKADEKPTTSEHLEAQHYPGDFESPNGVVEHCHRFAGDRIEPDQSTRISVAAAASEALRRIDQDRIRAALKKRKLESKKVAVMMMDGSSEDAWIERELEAGIELR